MPRKPWVLLIFAASLLFFRSIILFSNMKASPARSMMFTSSRCIATANRRFVTSSSFSLKTSALPRPLLMTSTSSSLPTITSKNFLVQSQSRLSAISNTFQRTFTTSSNMSNNNDDFKLENLYSVKGKICIVTGAGTGIGLMATQALYASIPFSSYHLASDLH